MRFVVRIFKSDDPSGIFLSPHFRARPLVRFLVGIFKGDDPACVFSSKFSKVTTLIFPVSFAVSHSSVAQAFPLPCGRPGGLPPSRFVFVSSPFLRFHSSVARAFPLPCALYTHICTFAKHHMFFFCAAHDQPT